MSLSNEEFTGCKTALQFYEKLHDEKFLDKFQKAFTSIRGQEYFDRNRIEYHITEWIDLEFDRIKKAEKKFSIVLEDTKRVLLTIFYLADSIRDSSTHYEKRQFTETLLHILRKQIKFFDELDKDEYYTQSFFKKHRSNDYGMNSLITYHNLQMQLQKEQNKVKELESKLREFENDD